jgi:hypothetical protein
MPPSLRKGGTLVLGGIHMSPIPSFDYDLLYQERVIRSVANNTRQDGEDFLKIAAEIPITTRTQFFPLEEANQALLALKNDAIPGAAVLQVAPSETSTNCVSMACSRWLFFESSFECRIVTVDVFEKVHFAVFADDG